MSRQHQHNRRCGGTTSTRCLPHLLLLLAALQCGCTVIGGRSWQSTYEDSPLHFTVPTDSSAAVWSRARAWFGGYNTPRLLSESDTLIESVQTRTGNGWYAVSITRHDTAGLGHFVVGFTVSDPKDKEISSRGEDRAHELAYIAHTGDNQQAFIQRGAE